MANRAHLKRQFLNTWCMCVTRGICVLHLPPTTPPDFYTHRAMHMCVYRMIKQLLMLTDNQHCIYKQMSLCWQQATA